MPGRQLSKELIEDLSVPEPNTGCWLNLNCRSGKRGYGFIRFGARRVRAHRASWEAFNGPIPEQMHILHKCDTPQCVNPDHLFLGTHDDNMRDRKEKGRCAVLRGEKSGMAKLSDADVLVVRERLGRGERGSSIARSIGVSKQLVSAIKTNVARRVQ